MNVPFVDLKIQYHSIKPEIDRAIAEVLESASFVMGENVKVFEAAFAKTHRAAFCIGTSSGTDSVHLSLWGLGVSQGDAVILPVNTFFATAEGVAICGATPLFMDCDPESYNIDTQKLKEFIERDCRMDDAGSLIHLRSKQRIRCLLPVHLFGQPADMDPILTLARAYHLRVVEDACQAHLADYFSKENNLWRRVGTYGDAGAFSFYPGKNLGAYGEGGAVLTNDPALYEKMWLIHDHGSRQKYGHEVIGHNYRLEGLQAAVLNVKLRYIESWTQRRRLNAEIYGSVLKGVDEVTPPREMSYAKHVYHLYVIRAQKRDALRSFLKDKGIETGLHYPFPLHLQKAFDHRGYKEGDFPVAEGYAKEILSLPMFPELTEAQIRFVVESIKEFYS